MRDLSIAEQCIPRKCKDDLVSRRQVYKLKLASDNDWEFGQALMDMPSAESDKNAPKTFKEQMNLECAFCRCHERGDTLYESSDWDGGVGFDYIRDIKYCPICGRGLLDGLDALFADTQKRDGTKA